MTSSASTRSVSRARATVPTAIHNQEILYNASKLSLFLKTSTRFPVAIDGENPIMDMNPFFSLFLNF